MSKNKHQQLQQIARQCFAIQGQLDDIQRRIGTMKKAIAEIYEKADQELNHS